MPTGTGCASRPVRDAAHVVIALWASLAIACSSSTIDGGASDVSVADATGVDASDGVSDASDDSGAAGDAASDPADVSVNAEAGGPDVASDAGPDTSDVSDASSDTGPGTDAAEDVRMDVSSDAAGDVASDAVDDAIDDVRDDPATDAATDPIEDAATDATEGDAADAMPDVPVELDPLVLYLAPDGDDRRDGTTPGRAIRTLERAHAIVSAEAEPRDVEVRIAEGRYPGQTVTWTTTFADHTIAFVRADPDGDRPVFDGCTRYPVVNPATDCPGGTWFRLRHSAGEETNLTFEYLRVENYGTAISFDGARNVEATSNGSNRVYGCYFSRIGNVFNEALDPSTAALRLVNSDDNVIANNHFVDVVNTRSGGLIHAIYVAHMSDRNRIERNRFQRSTGDPVRVRDYSNDNVVNENRFIRVGVEAAYTTWYCDHDARDDCTKPEPECPSWGNQFRDNTLDGTWSCASLGAFRYYLDDTTTGCSPPSADARRLRTSGNTRTDTPCAGD